MKNLKSGRRVDKTPTPETQYIYRDLRRWGLRIWSFKRLQFLWLAIKVLVVVDRSGDSLEQQLMFHNAVAPLHTKFFGSKVTLIVSNWRMLSHILRKKRGTVFYARKCLRYTSLKSGRLHSILWVSLLLVKRAQVYYQPSLLQMLMVVLIHSESFVITMEWYVL